MTTKKVLPAKITARWLAKFGACDGAVETFAELWPRGLGNVTAASVQRAVNNGVAVYWLLGMVCDRAPTEATCACGTSDFKTIAKYIRDHQRAPRNA